MRLSLSAALVALAAFHLMEAGLTTALANPQISAHPAAAVAATTVRKNVFEEIDDYLNTLFPHRIDRQERSNFKEIFGVDSSDAMKASMTHAPTCEQGAHGGRKLIFHIPTGRASVIGSVG